MSSGTAIEAPLESDEAVTGSAGGLVLETKELPDCSTIVSALVDLPEGWNRTQTRIRFVLPVAYPSAQPDCFYADADLRLAGGAMPMNSGMQPLEGAELVWFSWHLSTWSPTTDNTSTYLRFVESRLRDVR
ncbi:MAG: hypothetical protein JWR52_1058 [Marmoricola sp.]|nr:hypothetical protein [Marmoricola sp.]